MTGATVPGNEKAPAPSLAAGSMTSYLEEKLMATSIDPLPGLEQAEACASAAAASLVRLAPAIGNAEEGARFVEAATHISQTLDGIEAATRAVYEAKERGLL